MLSHPGRSKHRAERRSNGGLDTATPTLIGELDWLDFRHRQSTPTVENLIPAPPKAGRIVLVHRSPTQLLESRSRLLSPGTLHFSHSQGNQGAADRGLGSCPERRPIVLMTSAFNGALYCTGEGRGMSHLRDWDQAILEVRWHWPALGTWVLAVARWEGPRRLGVHGWSTRIQLDIHDGCINVPSFLRCSHEATSSDEMKV